MSQTTSLPIHNPHQTACTCRHRWCPRRIHAFLGLFLGVFVAAHLAVALTGLWPERYQNAVTRIHALGPVLPVIELTAIFVPLIVQTLYGLRMLMKVGMAYRTDKKSRGGDLRFFLQRVSAVILRIPRLSRTDDALLGFPWVPGRDRGAPTTRPRNRRSIPARPGVSIDRQSGLALLGAYDPRHAGNRIVSRGLYAIGIWAVCYHLANGLATMRHGLGNHRHSGDPAPVEHVLVLPSALV